MEIYSSVTRVHCLSSPVKTDHWYLLIFSSKLILFLLFFAVAIVIAFFAFCGCLISKSYLQNIVHKNDFLNKNICVTLIHRTRINNTWKSPSSICPYTVQQQSKIANIKEVHYPISYCEQSIYFLIWRQMNESS